MAVKTEARPRTAEIRPFTVQIPDADLADLRRRIAATRWPEKETVPDQSQGPQLATVQALARYWEKEYDWRTVEARLNAVPQFLTEIDGLDIHFIHVRSKHEDALPLIVTHGWPGSIIEQLKIIGPLTDPTAHGASASDAFHLVIPSMPGYGFSGKPTQPGWGPEHIARAWTELMRRLGYTRFVAQGGDWGAIITDLMGVQAPPELAGIHVNMPGAVPPDIDALFQSDTTGANNASGKLPSGLSPEERRACEQLDFVWKHVAYGLIMATRPQTLTALADSPVGLAAFLLDHDAASLALISRVFAGQSEGLTRDDVLDNITLFWLTNTAVSAGRLYAENKLSFFATKGVSPTVPVAVSVFPDELYQAPRSWAEQAYPQLIHYNKLDRGGHFAAWEQPRLLSEEIRAGFRSLR
ncbi:epoxide hydrolase family protein [Micromonospora sp. NPDC049366]|uniref:epoxide hydrolase family protein n=1 Tax=Micromonospora sp. NPDC049366 TaxID=3364271 RepID=UPI0037A389B1